MKITEAFAMYEQAHPEGYSDIRKTSLALRRSGVDTVEKLRDLLEKQPQQLLRLRDIGPKRLALVRRILLYLQEGLKRSENPHCL